MTKTPEQKAADNAARAAKRAAKKAALDAAAVPAAPDDSASAGAVSAAPAPVVPAAATDPITVKFRDHQGETVERTFSKDVHGEGFATLADEFKKTNATKIVQ